MKTKCIWLAAIVALFTAYSCHEQMDWDDLKMKEHSVGAGSPVVAPGLTPANPDNPYDSIGIWHNEILDFLYADGMPTAGCNDGGEIANRISEYARQRWNVDIHPEPLTVPLPVGDDTGRYLDRVARLINLSPYGAAQFRELLGIAHLHAEKREGFSYRAYREVVTELEARIMNDARLPDYEAPALLAAASVARYSMFYWTNGGGWPEIVPEPKDTGDTGRLTFKRIIRFIGTVTADVWGAALGMTVNPYYAAGKASSDSAEMHTAISWCMPGEL